MIHATDVFELMSIVGHAARAITNEPIQVSYHQLKVTVPGLFEVASYQLQSKKLMSRVNVNDVAIYNQL